MAAGVAALVAVAVAVAVVVLVVVLLLLLLLVVVVVVQVGRYDRLSIRQLITTSLCFRTGGSCLRLTERLEILKKRD